MPRELCQKWAGVEGGQEDGGKTCVEFLSGVVELRQFTTIKVSESPRSWARPLVTITMRGRHEMSLRTERSRIPKINLNGWEYICWLRSAYALGAHFG